MSLLPILTPRPAPDPSASPQGKAEARPANVDGPAFGALLHRLAERWGGFLDRGQAAASAADAPHAHMFNEHGWFGRPPTGSHGRVEAPPGKERVPPARAVGDEDPRPAGPPAWQEESGGVLRSAVPSSGSLTPLAREARVPQESVRLASQPAAQPAPCVPARHVHHRGEAARGGSGQTSLVASRMARRTETARPSQSASPLCATLLPGEAGLDLVVRAAQADRRDGDRLRAALLGLLLSHGWSKGNIVLNGHAGPEPASRGGLSDAD